MIQQPTPIADRLVVGARVHTFSEAQPAPHVLPTAVAIARGRIVAVGTESSLSVLVDATTVIDEFPGATIVPGLIDSHTHIVFGLELTRGVQLTDLSLEQVREKLSKATASAVAGEWLFGWGLDPNIFNETGFSGRIFDSETKNNPAFLRMRDAHSAVINSVGIQAARLTGTEVFPDESAIGVDDDGRPTGYLLELAAMNLVLALIPQESVEVRANRLSEVLEGMARAGITSTHVMDFHEGSREVLELLESRGTLPLRLRFSPIVPPGSDAAALVEFAELQGLHGRRWRVEGVKFMIDGTVDNGSAWLTQPDCYGEGVRSIWTDPAAYLAALRFYTERGISTATHAIGDRGVEFVLDSIESLGIIASKAHHRIEHIETIPDETVPRFKMLGVSASMQPIHGVRHTLADRTDNWSVRLGEERSARGWRSGDLRRAGATVALGSDWPVTPFDPRFMMAESILRRPIACPDLAPVQLKQALTPQQAFEGYTTHAARSIGSIDEGSIAPGNLAALTVFASDPLSTPPEQFPELTVVETYVDGIPTH